MLEFHPGWLLSGLKTGIHQTSARSFVRSLGIETSFSAWTLIQYGPYSKPLLKRPESRKWEKPASRWWVQCSWNFRVATHRPGVWLQGLFGLWNGALGSTQTWNSRQCLRRHQVSVLRKSQARIFPKAPLNSLGLGHHLAWFFFFTRSYLLPSLFLKYMCLFIFMSMCLWCPQKSEVSDFLDLETQETVN